MGDSDDEYQSSHNNAANSGSGNVGNGNGHGHSASSQNFIATTTNKKNVSRDKFYRERDDSSNANYQRSNENRRDWNSGDRLELFVF